MAYLTATDFRANSKKWYTAQLVLSEEEAPTADITSAIASMSLQFDEWTHDHYETESLTLELNGDGTGTLLLPKRCTAVTTVKTRDPNGTLTTQSATAYRLVSSLDSAGARRRSKEALDLIEVVDLGPGLSSVNDGTYVWPCGPQTVQVAGSFGWTTVPDRVKRAVALMVYDQFRGKGDSLHRAGSWSTDGADYNAATTTPSGLPEVDGIIAELAKADDYSLA